MGNGNFDWDGVDDGVYAAYYNTESDEETGLISSFDLSFLSFSSDSSVSTWAGGCLMLCLFDDFTTYDGRYKAYYAGNWDITSDPTIGTVSTSGDSFSTYITYGDTGDCDDCTVADSIELTAIAEKYSTLLSTGVSVYDTYKGVVESMINDAISGTEQTGNLLNFKKSTPLSLDFDKVSTFDTDAKTSTVSADISTTKSTKGTSNGSSGGY